MTDTEKNIPPKKVLEVVNKALAAFVKDPRNMSPALLMGLLYEGLERLRDCIAGADPDITWAAPYAQLEYDVDHKSFALLAKGETPPLSDEDKKLWDEYLIPKERAVALAKSVTASTMEAMLFEKLHELTKKAIVIKRGQDIILHASPEIQAEYEKTPEAERRKYQEKIEEGWTFAGLGEGDKELPFSGKDDAGLPWKINLAYQVLPLVIDADENRAFFPVRVGLSFIAGNPSTWTEKDKADFWTYILGTVDAFVKELREKGEKPVEILPPSRVSAIGAAAFPIASKYTRTIYGLSKDEKDLPLLKEYHELQNPLNWAVGLALFSLTDEEEVRLGNWHEAELEEIAARVNCLDEDGVRVDRHDADAVLAEVVKLHKRQNTYYEIKSRKVGKYYTNDVVIGSYYAIPELEILFIDTETKKLVKASDPSLRELVDSLLFDGRRIRRPRDEDEEERLKTFPKGTKEKAARYRPHAVRWRWVQAFRDDLLISPDLIESGERKGRPKRTRGGRVLRKGSLIRVAFNIFDALKNLRQLKEKYACRLLIILASNLNKPEDGIAADRVYRMLALEETPGQPGRREDIVASAVARLIGIGVLLPRSDTTPRMDPNPERRKGPYYRLYRSPEYFPKAGITTKEGAIEIEKAYSEPLALPAPAPAVPGQTETQTHLPGLEAAPLPSGAEISTAREAAGMNLRDFARAMAGPTFSTWSRYEAGKSVRAESISSEVWQRVRAFVAEHGPKKA